MGLGRSRPEAHGSHPGEPGVGADLQPPFTAADEPTAWLFNLNRFGIRPGLVRIQGLLDDLGNPERELNTLVTAGTNGKGSTTRILALLLQAAGHKVATYTSPHLLKVHERIRIDDQDVDEDDFRRRVEEIKPLTEKHEASWFETLTALSVQIARDEKVDYFCCETGLGGRLDATNALPAVAVLLTSVGLDHQKILGETRQEIAAEKLGLLKKGVPLFCAVDADLRSQVFQAAVRGGSPCYFLDELTRWEVSNPWESKRPGWDLALRETLVRGLPDPGTEAQRRNIALAVLALTELQSGTGPNLLPREIPSALGNLFLPGRFQHLLASPDFYLDTGHNSQALAGVLKHFLEGGGPGKNILLFGSMHDKEIAGDLTPLIGRFDAVLGAPVSLPRSRTSQELRDLFTSWGFQPTGAHPGGSGGLAPCSVADDMGQALRHLARNLRPEDRVLVTGSCFTVAETMYKLGFENLEQTRALREAGPILEKLMNGNLNS